VDVKKLKMSQLKDTSYLNGIYDVLNDGIIMCDGEFKITYANTRSCEILGYSSYELSGKSITELVTLGFRDHFEKHISCARPDRIKKFQVVWETKSDNLVNSIVVSCDIFDAKNNFNGKLVVLSEISDQIHISSILQIQQQAVLRKLIAIICHEMRNPLGTISNSIYAIREKLDSDDPDIENYINRIERNIRRCTRVLDEFCALSRCQDFQLTSTDMNDFIRSVISGIDIPLEIEIIQELSDDTTIAIDRERFKECIEHLLDNSIQAIVETELHVENSSEPVKKQIKVKSEIKNGLFKILFQGTGQAGLEDQVSDIFDPLVSMEVSDSDLSLPIAKIIMEQHNGGIELESEPGGGTSVIIWLPLSMTEGKE
jgi:PAS domain S-box-containing protein